MRVDANGYRVGDRVRVIKGSLANLCGTIMRPGDKELGGSVQARMDSGQVLLLAPRNIRKFGILDDMIDENPHAS